MRWATMLMLSVLMAGLASGQEVSVDSNFEGGSARVIEIDQATSTVRIMPAGDPARGWPAWWYLRISGLTAGQTIHLNVVPSSRPIPSGHPGAGRPLAANWALPRAATWSSDQVSWQRTRPGLYGDAGATYDITAPVETIWVAWGPPATPSIADDWIETFSREHSFAKPFELATTREDRAVRGLRIAEGNLAIPERPVVWLQARQHAWESGSSWVARGIMSWLCGNSEDAIWLRNHALVFVIPIMDVDRTATGDGGKESSPHDHNRDWSDQPHYHAVAAAQQQIKKFTAENRMSIFVDLHNPGPSDGRAFFYVAPDEAIEESRKPRRQQFLQTVAANWRASIRYDPRTRSTGPSYHQLWQRISGTWVTQNSNPHTVAVCLETPWNTPGSTTDGYQQVSDSLATAISRFLQSDLAASP